ncbi:hypothetical protein AGABI2DRAFT_146675 [Agaricus bisporus var. bisporus H97]|uniref:hypothetical protein n=1 Tax=Agaricus bisporus var. bisporus (strain H97 / ATCC MYA-4626 / FGSC 10389) TaxID=936046 RepID=UPI00029F51D0|nr:hypothetical protein AGABI2DRAFT_146675 [Agaricus bisporus var. bisporus H97]EKV42158.1 hypothetical protein AGABI2DRAFT_146675 [Agaricus bisporus var. bisporus H97]
MAPGRKRVKFKKWLWGFFHPKGSRYVLDGPHARPGGFFHYAEGFVLIDPIMTSVQVDNTTVINMQGTATQVMNFLSQHIIRGAAHDDSAREPPPRCHPDTRVKFIARITAWFDGQAQQELLLWITGPAGVGKSAIVQTFAEHLVKSKSLGASVFISRPNKRNNSHGIFITIAYQLATRIEAYRNFIVDRLGLDPSLLNKGIMAQFATFIVEPFVEKKIGAGGKRWGILLDGLDELQGQDAQCEIIQLISTFVHEHHDVPLVWIIASRPESHISNTFEDDEVKRSCWSEYIPIDSTEACDDVERFLRSSFEVTQKTFRHSVDSDWPSNTHLLKLTAAASGLFVYAEVAMQFIRDSDHADPVSRLEVLLAVIDRSRAVLAKENPFVHLDALYHEILSLIPSTFWPTAKRLLALPIYTHRTRMSAKTYSHIPQTFQTLRGMSILFDVPRNVIYASLNKCRSTLKILDWKAAHKGQLTFLHASFADYLKDSSRSGNFYVGSVGDVEEDVALSSLGVWIKCTGDDIATIKSTWHRNCSKSDDKPPSRAIAKFHANLFRNLVSFSKLMACHMLEKPGTSPAYVQLHKLPASKLCYFFNAFDLAEFVYNLMRLSPNSYMSSDPGLLREVQLRDLEFGHLDLKEMSPAHAHFGGKFYKGSDWILHRD